MVDTTQAFEEQMHLLWSRRPSSSDHRQERYAPPELIILTHAHTGHYVGLWQFDRSVLAAPATTVLVPPRTAGLLKANEPWQAMIREGFLKIDSFEWDVELESIEGVAITPWQVPHRSEWPTDTAALHIRGPNSTVLYLPDIDFWDEWDRDVVEAVSGVDVAILDGSFWAQPTSPDVPHPPIVETIERLQSVVDSGTSRVLFTHLNHSNPVAAISSAERQELESRGYGVAEDGMAIEI